MLLTAFGRSVLLVNCAFTILSLEIVFSTSGKPPDVFSVHTGKCAKLLERQVYPDVSWGTGHRREDRYENKQLECRKMGPGVVCTELFLWEQAGGMLTHWEGRALRGHFLQEEELQG